MSSPLTPLPELILPDYVVYQYREDCWKVVRHNSTFFRAPLRRSDEEGPRHFDKLPAALSRARRVVLELALCNKWDWFATFTISGSYFDRKDLASFYSRFNAWLRKVRMRSGAKLPYVLVPERHKDGSWHMHGFFNSDLDPFLVSFYELDQQGFRSESGQRLPPKLFDFFDWPEYREKFGFCSFGRIHSQDAAAFYVTKYISKSFQGDADRFGLKLYYCSQGLNRAEKLGEVYGPAPQLDACLSNHYEYCSTGFLFLPKEVGDQPMLDLLEMYSSRLSPILFECAPEVQAEVDQYYEAAEQLCFWG